jgi:hypothetical protein
VGEPGVWREHLENQSMEISHLVGGAITILKNMKEFVNGWWITSHI